ncbi:uncharacterized protein F4807DRAFT_416792 [Annulohypoxylon truncatum]|uniref:uncharacterized protein n=1 Tax=Annulohypoxylon truncatum TaxID=327061 RepID=UPI002007461F|nr:uncharacterized protein F4807DRAFT_416792 [Annulohypoxylon truncatum]KAI1211901.1 hypothetical protein F4807DRAFT_416792 [Annulohypoxylon truncatum]
MAGKDRERKHLRLFSSHRRQNVKPRQAHRRPPAGSGSVPYTDGIAESMEDKISLTERSDIDPAYAQTDADMTENWDATLANPSVHVSSTGFLRSSITALQEGNHANAAAYYLPRSSYDLHAPDSSLDNTQLTSPYSTHTTTGIGTAWSGSYPTYPSSSDGYATTMSTSGDMISYIQPQQYDRGHTSYDVSITSSPPGVEVMDDDDNTQAIDNISSQDPGSNTQALPNPSYSPPSRRWSIDNHHGSTV